VGSRFLLSDSWDLIEILNFLWPGRVGC